MDSSEINLIASEIMQLSKNGNFKQAFEKYNHVKHPVICYHLGLYAYNDDYRDIATTKFIQGSKFGFTYPNDFSNTLHSDPIGQCIYYLLAKNLINQNDIQKRMQLIGLAYVYLSISINLIGNKAYQSYESRARLLTMQKYADEITSIMDYIGVKDIALPLIIGNDYYESYLGYSTYLYQSETPHTEELREKGISIFVNVVSKHFGGNLGLKVMLETASGVHKEVFHNAEILLNFANGLENKNYFFQ